MRPNRTSLIRTVTIALVVFALAGCVVVPAYTEYSYGPRYAYPGYYPGYPYRRGYYPHRSYWHQAP